MNSEERTEKKSKKKLVAVLLIALLLIGAGLTAAYFTDHKAVMNEFTVGGVKVELTEPKWETDESGKQAAQEIRPNMTIVKDPKVTNTGESDAYVFIRFRIPHDRFAAQGTFENIVVNTGYRPEHPELWPPIVDSREAADFTEKLGQCTDFDEYCQGPVDTSNKDLFKKLGREFSVTCIRDESPSFV